MNELPTAFHISHREWSTLAHVDEIVRETANKIEALAPGLTPRQFTQAVSMALDFVGRYSTLSPQSYQQPSEPS